VPGGTADEAPGVPGGTADEAPGVPGGTADEVPGAPGGADEARARTAVAADERAGVALGLGAYAIWGSFPLFFPLLEPARPAEILAHRIVWSLLAFAAVLAVARRFPALAVLVRDRRRVALLTAAAALIALNWGVFIYAVNSDHVIEGSLGYFINPLVSVALALAACAVAVLTVDYGRPPWIALTLALSFGTYGLVKKVAGVGAAEGLAIETAILLVPALAYVAAIQAGGGGTFTHEAPAHALLLAASGPVTAAPLLMFSASVTRVRLSVVGMLQYVTPTLQFLLGLLVLGEAMPASRWIGFAFVWAALTVFAVDLVASARRSARGTPPDPAGAAAQAVAAPGRG
jgi:chloramphenicol-sensitive protein RarD